MAESADLFENSEEAQFIDGRLKAVFFASNDSFFKVLLIEVETTNVDWSETEIVVTGNFGDLTEGNDYHFTGKLVEHPRFGMQFSADNYTSTIATTHEGIVKYLSSDQFPGVGEKTAERLVHSLGDDILNKIENDASILDDQGLTEKQRHAILENLQTDDKLAKIIIGLNSYGFTSQLASTIYSKYHEDALKILQENPYQLVEDIEGISFRKADAIARKNGIAVDSDERIRAGLMYSVEQLCKQNGDTYTTTGPLLAATRKLLLTDGQNDLDPDQLANCLVQLAKDAKIVGEKDRIYLTNLYNSEVQIAEHLNRLIKNQDSEDVPNVKDIRKQLRVVEKQFQINYDDSQERAIIAAIKSPVFILTGGPGTGKTTIINGIVNTYARLNDYSLDINSYKDSPFPIVLAAPTGRAAKHMSESTGLIASTIHRLLGLNGHQESDEQPTKDIEGALVIIDEMSMVDTALFKSLVKAVPNNMKVVLVGDQDQLPSVGPGQVFHDLLTSRQIPAMELETIYRQEKGSSIIKLAHEIHQGQLPSNFINNQPDRSFINCHENQIASVVQQVVKRAKDKQFSLMDTQVLAPMYRGQAGINQLNNVIQDVWHPQKARKSVKIREHQYYIGDKVLQLVNNPEKNVFNGDIGIIAGMDQLPKQTEPSKITIDFDETEVTYDKNEWNQFMLAYCTSIHKAQGSEFSMVILPLVHQYSRMLQRNLLYTAITRASDFLIMIGEPDAFEQCANTISVNRKTTLPLRLVTTIDNEIVPEAKKSKDNLTVENEEHPTDIFSEKTTDTQNNGDETEDFSRSRILTAEDVLTNAVDPMIGMKNVKPTDFSE